MPTYEFYCEDCNRIYEVFSKTIQDVSVTCACCGAQLERIVTAPNIHTAAKSNQDGSGNRKLVVQELPCGGKIATRESALSKAVIKIPPNPDHPSIGKVFSSLSTTEEKISEIRAITEDVSPYL